MKFLLHGPSLISNLVNILLLLSHPLNIHIMTSTSPILLILGFGPNVGQHVMQSFAAKGYKIALSSRKSKEEDSTKDQAHIPSDLSNPSSVIDLFSKVKERLGLPSVVVYNGTPYLKTCPNLLLT